MSFYDSNKPRSYYESTRSEMLKYIPSDAKTILEFGCAHGNFSELIKKNFNCECWGVEVDKKAADIASKKLDKVINEEAIGSLELLPSSYFDCVIFNDILEHLVDPFSLLENVKSKLTAQAVVVMSLPNIRYWSNLKAFAVRGDWEYKDYGILDRTHLRFFTYKSIIKMFNRLNYEIVIIEGLGPSRSRNFRIFNALFLNKLWDARFRQFACVVRIPS